MNAASPLFQIEAKRVAAGISRETLAGAAGMSSRHLCDLVAGVKEPRGGTIVRLRDALARLQRKTSAKTLDEHGRLVLSCYRAALALLCERAGVDPAEVDRQDPSRKATADAGWTLASRLRERAIALVNNGLAVSQAELARALGLTPAAISLAMNRVENARGADAALDAELSRFEALFMGDA